MKIETEIQISFSCTFNDYFYDLSIFCCRMQFCCNINVYVKKFIFKSKYIDVGEYLTLTHCDSTMIVASM